jgi:hypothetical protein
MICPMKAIRYAAAALSVAASLPALAQTMAPAEMRSMSAAEFQRHIDQEGAARFVQRLMLDADPHAPEEPNYDIVLEHVAEGGAGWLAAAAEIAPYTDPVFSQGLRVAIADALVANPAGVLKMIGTEEHFDEACGYPFVQQTVDYMHQHQREALAALRHVREPQLAGRKAECRRQLLNVPEKALEPSAGNTPQDTAFGPSERLF